MSDTPADTLFKGIHVIGIRHSDYQYILSEKFHSLAVHLSKTNQ